MSPFGVRAGFGVWGLGVVVSGLGLGSRGLGLFVFRVWGPPAQASAQENQSAGARLLY